MLHPLSTSVKCLKESEDYNFQTCVKTSLAEKVGCRPPWDSWSPASSPLCARVEDMARHEEYDWDLYNFEQKIVLNFTGCKVLTIYIYNIYNLKLCIYKVPCKYREYKLVGEPQGGSTAVMGLQGG